MLELINVCKTFNPGTVNEKKAITDLSLHLNKGEFVTVIGSNGAGKSTLMSVERSEPDPQRRRFRHRHRRQWGREVNHAERHRRIFPD